MRNHQEQQQEQELMVPMDSQKNPNFETHNHRHQVMVPVDSQKNPNLETTRNHHHVPPSPSSSSQDFKRSHDEHTSQVLKKINEDEGFVSKNAYDPMAKKPYVSCSSLVAGADMTAPPLQDMLVVEESGRERLKKHRVEMAGRVWIPDIWGHEDLLKDWIDCTVFDSSLGNNNIMSARAALVQEGRSTLRIENQC
ncbi:hypothetical protein L2E82_00829 [Cichorium intybus]|uniref:Uncharacterized protein n=1 Tax=Cichorium intybus TaxID=13427 RepID=A0ACB9GYN0_CICIN|nr:hypothetical protein L2E82_00829 [Cichorium intybus]